MNRYHFPVFICGFSDLNNVFHPIGLSVCTKENQHDYQFMLQSIQIGLSLVHLEQLPANNKRANI